MSHALRLQRDQILKEELEKLENPEEAKIETPVENNPEEETFRKRYADLRRYAQKQENELKERITQLENQNRELQKKDLKLPKTDEEFAAWAEKYPDVVDNIKTLVLKEIQSAREEVERLREEVTKDKRAAEQDKALAILLKAHPDFQEIAQSQDFHDWLATKSKVIRDTMYEDGADVNDAIDIVTMYKEVKGITKTNDNKKKSTPVEDTNKAALNPVKSKAPSTPGVDNSYIFKESDIAKMSEREYRQHEATIAKQISEGKFIYDMTGAAR